jgi:hypothetical protein
MKKKDCEGNGISLVYKEEGPACRKEHSLVYVCPYKASLSIASCEGSEYSLLKSDNLEGVKPEEEYAIAQLKDKFNSANFWKEWDKELKEWRLECEQ